MYPNYYYYSTINTYNYNATYERVEAYKATYITKG